MACAPDLRQEMRDDTSWPCACAMPLTIKPFRAFVRWLTGAAFRREVRGVWLCAPLRLSGFARGRCLLRHGGPSFPARPCPNAVLQCARRRMVYAGLGLVLLLIAAPAPAKTKRRPARSQAAHAPAKSRQWRQARIRADRHKHPPDFFRRLRNLPPAQQDRILRNDTTFHKLPAWRRQQIRRNLARWNALSPQQKGVIRQRQAILQRLPPQKRQELRGAYSQYQQLGPYQKQRVMTAFARLRSMTPARRRQFLNSPRFQRQFGPREQRVLRGLARVLPQ
jgi:hypothetical protein